MKMASVLMALGAFVATVPALTGAADLKGPLPPVRPTTPVKPAPKGKAAPAGLPDLRVRQLTADPRTVAAGDVVRVGNVIVNEGARDSGAFHISYVISSDYSITGDDIRIHSIFVPNIRAGASYEFPTPSKTIAMRIPAGLRHGSYYVGVVVDYQGEVAEADEQNNIKQTPVRVTPVEKADLMITSLGVDPVTVTAGETVRTNYRVNNVGKKNSGQYNIKFYLSRDAAITASDVYLGMTHHQPSIAPRANYTPRAPGRILIPADTAPGAWYFGAIADGDNEVDESSEGNNTRSVRITVSETARPDLVFTRFALDAPTAAAGQPIGISAQIADRIRFGGYGFRVRFYLSADSTITADDTLLASKDMLFSLTPFHHPSEAVHVSGTLPTGLSPGTYYVGGILDADGQVEEGNETNNIGKARLTVAPPAAPDLKVMSLRVSPTTVAREGSLTATAIIRNIGNAESGTFEVTFYYSPDSHITRDDYVLGGVPIVESRGGGSHSISKELHLHPVAGPGRGYIGVIVDSGNVVRESSEANNSASTSISVSK